MAGSTARYIFLIVGIIVLITIFSMGGDVARGGGKDTLLSTSSSTLSPSTSRVQSDPAPSGSSTRTSSSVKSKRRMRLAEQIKGALFQNAKDAELAQQEVQMHDADLKEKVQVALAGGAPIVSPKTDTQAPSISPAPPTPVPPPTPAPPDVEVVGLDPCAIALGGNQTFFPTLVGNLNPKAGGEGEDPSSALLKEGGKNNNFNGSLSVGGNNDTNAGIDIIIGDGNETMLANNGSAPESPSSTAETSTPPSTSSPPVGASKFIRRSGGGVTHAPKAKKLMTALELALEAREEHHRNAVSKKYSLEEVQDLERRRRGKKTMRKEKIGGAETGRKRMDCKRRTRADPEIAGLCQTMSQSTVLADPYATIDDCPLVHEVYEEGEGKTGACSRVLPPIMKTAARSQQHREGGGVPTTTTTSIKRRDKALVIYSMHDADSDRNLGQMNNFAFFWKTGVLPEGQPTTLYPGGVDYVFFRPSNAAERGQPSICAVDGNIRFVVIPRHFGGVSIAGRLFILEFLGYGTESWPYTDVTFLTSSVRGPFLNEGSSSWVDIVGQGSNTNPFRTLWSYSFQTRLDTITHRQPHTGNKETLFSTGEEADSDASSSSSSSGTFGSGLVDLSAAAGTETSSIERVVELDPNILMIPAEVLDSLVLKKSGHWALAFKILKEFGDKQRNSSNSGPTKADLWLGTKHPPTYSVSKLFPHQFSAVGSRSSDSRRRDGGDDTVQNDDMADRVDLFFSFLNITITSGEQLDLFGKINGYDLVAEGGGPLRNSFVDPCFLMFVPFKSRPERQFELNHRSQIAVNRLTMFSQSRHLGPESKQLAHNKTLEEVLGYGSKPAREDGGVCHWFKI